MLRPPRSAGLSSHRSQQQGQVSCRGRASPAAHSAPTAVHAPAATRERPPLFSPVSEAPLTSSSSGTDEELRLGWRTGIENHIAKGRILGSGSFGQVFHGAKLSEGTEVAVKSMPLQRGKLTKEATIRKLQKEVTILERMQECCSVVRLEDLFEDVANVYVVTELCAGGDLQHFSDVYGPLNERCLALIAFEVALIIKACHDFSIIHGDVKPANFCLKEEHVNPLCSSDATLRRTPWLKAIDFGCSQIHYGTQKLTKRSGTPVFMAPEIFQRSYSFEVDMWSFGVMLYQLYCRRFPFWSDDSYSRALSLDEVARAVTESPIAYDFGPWLQMSPEGLDFIQRCLIRDPEQRMTVVEALTHPWLAKQRCGACSTSSDTSCTQLNNITPFTARRDAAVAA